MNKMKFKDARLYILESKNIDDFEERLDDVLDSKIYGPVDFVEDNMVPPTIAIKLLEGHKSLICYAAIVAAIVEQRNLENWLIKTLIRKWVNCKDSQMKLIASIPGSGVPESLVPREERFDLKELMWNQVLINKEMERCMRELGESGMDVLVPYENKEDKL